MRGDAGHGPVRPASTGTHPLPFRMKRAYINSCLLASSITSARLRPPWSAAMKRSPTRSETTSRQRAREIGCREVQLCKGHRRHPRHRARRPPSHHGPPHRADHRRYDPGLRNSRLAERRSGPASPRWPRGRPHPPRHPHLRHHLPLRRTRPPPPGRPGARRHRPQRHPAHPAVLPHHLWRPSPTAAWTAGAAITSVHAASRPRPAPATLTPEEAFTRAVAAGDEYAIKFADTALDLVEIAADDSIRTQALSAALHATDLINPGA